MLYKELVTIESGKEGGRLRAAVDPRTKSNTVLEKAHNDDLPGSHTHVGGRFLL